MAPSRQSRSRTTACRYLPNSSNACSTASTAPTQCTRGQQNPAGSGWRSSRRSWRCIEVRPGFRARHPERSGLSFCFPFDVETRAAHATLKTRIAQVTIPQLCSPGTASHRRIRRPCSRRRESAGGAFVGPTPTARAKASCKPGHAVRRTGSSVGAQDQRLLDLLHHHVAVRLGGDRKLLEDVAQQPAVLAHAADPRLDQVVEATRDEVAFQDVG